jgi:hypothetical protein
MNRNHLLTFGALLLAAGCAERREVRTPRVMREFPAAGVKRVVIRAAEAESGEVIHDPTADSVVISGQPSDGAPTHHPPGAIPEGAAADRALDFVARPYGPVLVISSRNEIQYTHHCDRLRALRVRVPAGVEVTWRRRDWTGDGAPDLAPP